MSFVTKVVCMWHTHMLPQQQFIYFNFHPLKGMSHPRVNANNTAFCLCTPDYNYTCLFIPTEIPRMVHSVDRDDLYPDSL